MIATCLYARPLVGVIAAVPDEAKVILANMSNKQRVKKGPLQLC